MKNAVISGGSQGIGKAIAEKLLSEGFNIAICARNAKELNALQILWTNQYPNRQIICFKTDMSIKAEVRDFAQSILNAFGHIDILVNNAGVFMPGLIAEEEDGQLEDIMAINLYSAYYLSRAFLPAMKAIKAGHIFNMCSVAGLKAYPNGGSYGISKYALMGFNDNLREELKPYNIKVTAISPGATASRSWDGSGVNAERLMEAADVANMLYASYVLSKKANVEHIVMRPQQGDI